MRRAVLALALMPGAGAARADLQTWALPGVAAHVAADPAPRPTRADAPPTLVTARLTGATDRYPHDVLGGIPGWTVMEVTALSCATCRRGAAVAGVALPDTLVFEDVAPRLWDVDGDGLPEVVVVESDARRGARLAVWSYDAKAEHLSRRATTPFIGTRFRWLAPAGIADFDGDGQPDIAYVETPHLGRTLRIVTLQGDALVEIAALPGVTNHRIGDAFISGGVRHCGGVPEIVLANRDWTGWVGVRMDRGALLPRDLGPLTTPDRLRAPPACP